MKYIGVIIFLVIFKMQTVSQVWLDQLLAAKSNRELTLYDYQKAFYSYWEPYHVNGGKYIDKNKVTRKAPGWKQFKRWEWYMESQIDKSTGAFPKTSALDEYRKTIGKTKALKAGCIWANLGTSTSLGGYAGIGRINCIAFHPTDINTYWVGTPSGGLWKTTNNGNSWVCLTDSLGVMGISSVLVPPDYQTSKTIYIGTGDRDHFDNRSIGVLKSTDGGINWNNTGLTFKLFQNFMITKMELDPGNSNHLLVATNGGVYESFDAAISFNKINSNYYIDIEHQPGVFNRFYCGTKNTGRIDTLVFNGTVWQSGTARTVASGRRVEIAVCPSKPSWVYAIVADDKGGLSGIYKSEDNGVNVNLILAGSTKNLLGWNSSASDEGGQGFYDLSIIVLPANENVLFIGGINTWKSTNAGQDWTLVNHWNGDKAQEVHADKHNFAFRNDGALFELNDGGIYISNMEGISGSWTDKTNGITISQIYRIGVAAETPDEIMTGLQDNGSKLFSNSKWNDVKGGDGMECIIDYSDINVQYASYANGQITRTLDHWNSNRLDIEPKDNEGKSLGGAWITPYVMHPDNNQTIYAGYSDLYRSNNLGNNWTKISSFNSAELIRTIAICEYAASNLYTADLTHLWKSTDGGLHWSAIGGNLPFSSTANILSIVVKPDNPEILWVSLSGYQHDGVYQSTDGGNNWTSISSGLPQIPIYSLVLNKLNNSKAELYAGTELGVYYKDGNSDWMRYSKGLPNVVVSELEIYYDKTNPENSRVRAATYGRGLWEAPLIVSGNYVPDISPVSVFGIANNSALLSAMINNDYGSTVTESGFIISNSAYPVINDPFAFKLMTDPVVSAGEFSIDAADIVFPVFVRAYAINENGIGYGKAKAYDINGFPLFNENLSEYGIKIYPNPTRGEVIVQTDQLKKDMQISVKAGNGKTISTKTADKKITTFNLNRYSKGIYIIEITWPGKRLSSQIILN